VDTTLIVQPPTEVLLQRHESNLSIHKHGNGSMRVNDDASFGDTSFSQVDLSR
jgi:hypothetical protein